jgi:hypothetical protein
MSCCIKPWVCTAILIFQPAISLAGFSDRNSAAPFVLKFYVALIEGRDCPRLFELRNEAIRQGADNIQEEIMNERLRSVGCFDRTSKRMPLTEAPHGAVTQ